MSQQNVQNRFSQNRMEIKIFILVLEKIKYYIIKY